MTTQNQMKILITGAGGMLGTDLTVVLKPDFEVVGLEKRPVTHLSIPHDLCDLTQARKTRDAILSHQPNVVIHAAALTDVDYCEEHHDEAMEHNFEASKNVVAVCNDLDIPLIFYSTDYVFDGTKKGEYFESDQPHPVNFYGETKLQAERFIMENANRALIFRITWLFGVYGRCFPKAILRQAEEVKEMTVVKDQIGRPTYSWDVAMAMHTLLLSKQEVVFARSREIFHIGNKGTVNWADFARFLLKEAGFGATRIRNISSTQLKRPAARPLNSVLSLEKAKKVLRIELRNWEDATREFLPKWKDLKAAQEAKINAQAAEKENAP